MSYNPGNRQQLSSLSLSLWVLEKAWKIDMKVLWKKQFDKQRYKFENDARLNREPVKRF